MHELSLIRSILNLVEAEASRHAFDRVKTLKISFGRVSCVSPESLTFAFEFLAEGTKAEGAALVFETIPIVLYCFACGSEMETPRFDGTCPRCKGAKVLLTGGTEGPRLVELEVE